jgi:MFS family permease
MVVGFGVSSIIPLLYSTAGRLKMIPSSIAIATVAGTGYFGFLMGPPIIGYIAELTGLRYSFALIALAGLLITFLIRRVSIIN